MFQEEERENIEVYRERRQGIQGRKGEGEESLQNLITNYYMCKGAKRHVKFFSSSLFIIEKFSSFFF